MKNSTKKIDLLSNKSTTITKKIIYAKVHIDSNGTQNLKKHSLSQIGKNHKKQRQRNQKIKQTHFKKEKKIQKNILLIFKLIYA